MNMPGFTADASLYSRNVYEYTGIAVGFFQQDGKVIPQLACVCGIEDCTCCHCTSIGRVYTCHCWNVQLDFA
jgi:hypothetical protein